MHGNYALGWIRTNKGDEIAMDITVSQQQVLPLLTRQLLCRKSMECSRNATAYAEVEGQYEMCT
jgi:hypothetical protein